MLICLYALLEKCYKVFALLVIIDFVNNSIDYLLIYELIKIVIDFVKY